MEKEDSECNWLYSVLYADRVMTNYCVFVQPTSDNAAHECVMTHRRHTHACDVQCYAHRSCRDTLLRVCTANFGQ